MFIWIPSMLGILGPVLVPILSISVLLIYWDEYTRIVDRGTCSCSCWDTVFKGPYESGNWTGYKHFYFNATSNTAKIWILTVIGIIVHYECVKYLTNLMINKLIRCSMLFLCCLSAFSHHYAWWMYVNYYNDDFYSQWNHQTFFTLTELVSTAMVLHLANLRNKITSRKVLCIVGISILHIIAGGFDQFIMNVLKGEGMLHQKIRDVCLMVPDIFHLIIPIWLYQEARRENAYTKPLYRDKKLKYDVIATLTILLILLFILYKLL